MIDEIIFFLIIFVLSALCDGFLLVSQGKKK